MTTTVARNVKAAGLDQQAQYCEATSGLSPTCKRPSLARFLRFWRVFRLRYVCVCLRCPAAAAAVAAATAGAGDVDVVGMV